ncbi:pilus assembly protein PilP [Pseudomonas vancouverensis]|uniref:Pilus assembly protein PilP n=1 Tax=Pseudomonas vancouverensis TaxID=95300 RepID=A0A1H2PBI4_PSEVA|nr:pilus assembly protein PilP [Pseudomonas vancouverensis]KAB0493839.1 pilus assembly protein PilP [Pseudomonas vancouverensis]TDB58021.1 pilus assembly protein PilP [Pseudomonas vancouverensis]SDV15058.1 type IV pilus assembly protein PilP [Pseudomonas vancouverensis]
MSRGRCFAAALFMLVLAGCDDRNDFRDLDAYMAQSRLSAPVTIEPAPVLRSYPAFAYEAANLRSPFSPRQDVDASARRPGSNLVKPNPDRVRQYLEGFNIEQFEMVGTLANAHSSFALLRGAGGVHRLKVGDYLGRNDGRVVAITREQVDVIEIVPDGEGAWQERPRTIPLKKHS